jgi:hypothetical protein
MKIKTITFFILLIITANLAGCAKPYQEPSAGKIATISVYNPLRWRDTIGVMIFADPYNCIDPRLPSYIWHNRNHSFKIPAEQVTTVKIHDQAVPGMIFEDATFIVSFIPSVNANYLMYVYLDHHISHLRIIKETDKFVDGKLIKIREPAKAQIRYYVTTNIWTDGIRCIDNMAKEKRFIQ